MGRTLPSATVLLMQEEAAFARFRRALRRSDQLALDDLFVAARQHIAAVQFASHALPFEVYLLSMLLEEHKEVMRLRDQVEALVPSFPGETAGMYGSAADTPAAGGEPGPGPAPGDGYSATAQVGTSGGSTLPRGAVPPPEQKFRDPGFGLDDAPEPEAGDVGS